MSGELGGGRGCRASGSSKDELLDGIESAGGLLGGGRGRDGGRCGHALGHGDDVVDERVDAGDGGTDEELADLETGERALDDDGDAHAESRDSVVSVLIKVNVSISCS